VMSCWELYNEPICSIYGREYSDSYLVKNDYRLKLWIVVNETSVMQFSRCFIAR